MRGGTRSAGAERGTVYAETIPYRHPRDRLQFALWRECLALVEEGICDPRDIDTALMYSFCPRYSSIGIFEHFDNGGLTLNRATCANIFPVISARQDVPPVIDELIAAGKTG